MGSLKIVIVKCSLLCQCVAHLQIRYMNEGCNCLTHSLIHHFETVPNSKKLQTTTEMWLLKDFKVQIP